MLQNATIETPASNLSGILCTLAAMVVLTIMDAIAKMLVEASYSVFQILAVRGWIITCCFLGWLVMRDEVYRLKTQRPYHHAIRSTTGFFAPFCFFTALGTMPLADTVVITFAAPFLMTALSVPLLKESVGIHRWSAIVVGFIGVVLVVRPGGNTLEIGAIYALIACASYPLTQIMTRWMSSTESPLQIVFYFNVRWKSGPSMRCRLTESRQHKLLEFFVGEMTASTVANQVGVNKTTVDYFSRRLREIIAWQPDETSPLAGEVQADEQGALLRVFEKEWLCLGCDHPKYTFHHAFSYHQGVR